jgi:hypothetical protein
MIKDKDLIIGEYYYSKNYRANDYNNYIVKYLGDIDSCPHASCNTNKMHSKTFYLNGLFSNKITRVATPEEKHHLETCIYHGKYISYDQAMLNFHETFKVFKDESQELEPIYKKLLNL